MTRKITPELIATVKQWYLAVEALGSSEDALERWRQARRALGSRQEFAFRCGISVSSLDTILSSIRDEQRG